MINCILVDDEPLALTRARDFVSKLPYLNPVASFDNAYEALAYLKTNTVDILFLDINMDEFSGIQLLETSTVKCQVIITTAYPQYALKGYDLKVTDYLLKPYTFERFVQAVDRAQSNIQKETTTPNEPPITTAPETTPTKKFIFVKTEHRLEKILLSEILYIEGMGDYRRIHTTTKRIMTLQTFNDFEKEIPSTIICRVHKSYMVSLDKIESIEKERIKIATTTLPTVKEVHIPISETYKQTFYNLINQ
jgi:two-component system, LytTR family, response regulator